MPEELKPLSEDDIKFLTKLQNELNTQSTDGQADPRFWVVAENKREFGIADGYSDGEIICSSDCDSWDTIEDFIAYLIQNEHLDEGQIEKDREYEFGEVIEMIKTSCRESFYTCGYREHPSSIVPNTMFVTKKSCKQHIELNSYHYCKPHTYAMTAWRNPEVERLYKILRETAWNTHKEKAPSEAATSAESM